MSRFRTRLASLRPTPATTAGIIVAFLLTLATPARAAEIKLATWNLHWLTLRPTGSPGLPADLTTRAPEDFDRLRAYARELDADVVAVQEVDSYGALRRVFPADRYVLHLTRDRLTQKIGVAIRRGLRHDVHPDVPLSTDPGTRVRSGLDVTLRFGPTSLRLLAVHLKQGCRDPRRDRVGGRDCAIFHGQTDPLIAWIAARQQEGAAFGVLGDFNRWMDRRDSFLAALRRAAPLLRVTEGYASRCWHDEAFINHILIGGAAREWVTPDTLAVFRYRESGPEWRTRLSDHCPVSMRLRPPQP
jgi:endonuclease/exonuclease/phosphatase family metal-dependent hydrolase